MKFYFLTIFTLILASCSVNNHPIIIDDSSSDTINTPTDIDKNSIENFKITPHLKPLVVQVNVIILEDEKRPISNFNLNNPEEKQLLIDYFNRINLKWEKFYQPENLVGCYTGTDFYEDPKIRFQFNFHPIKDAYAWNYKNSNADLETKKYSGITPSDTWYIAYLDQKIANDPNIKKGINIYFTMDADNFDRIVQSKGAGYNLNGIEASQLPSTTNLKRTSSINAPNRYLKYIFHRYQVPIEQNTTWEVTRNWHIDDAVGTAHELGHSLGLNHNNQYHLSNACTYSLMSQNWQHQRNYLQPTEILKAHKNLRESNLLQFVTEDSFLGNTFTIPSDTNWAKTQRFYSNLELEPGVELKISEPIILSPQAKISFGKDAKIIFEKNGKIILPNGNEFTNYVNKKANSIIKL